MISKLTRPLFCRALPLSSTSGPLAESVKEFRQGMGADRLSFRSVTYVPAKIVLDTAGTAGLAGLHQAGKVLGLPANLLSCTLGVPCAAAGGLFGLLYRPHDRGRLEHAADYAARGVLLGIYCGRKLTQEALLTTVMLAAMVLGATAYLVAVAMSPLTLTTGALMQGARQRWARAQPQGTDAAAPNLFAGQPRPLSQSDAVQILFFLDKQEHGDLYLHIHKIVDEDLAPGDADWIATHRLLDSDGQMPGRLRRLRFAGEVEAGLGAFGIAPFKGSFVHSSQEILQIRLETGRVQQDDAVCFVGSAQKADNDYRFTGDLEYGPRFSPPADDFALARKLGFAASLRDIYKETYDELSKAKRREARDNHKQVGRSGQGSRGAADIEAILSSPAFQADVQRAVDRRIEEAEARFSQESWCFWSAEKHDDKARAKIINFTLPRLIQTMTRVQLTGSPAQRPTLLPPGHA